MRKGKLCKIMKVRVFFRFVLTDDPEKKKTIINSIYGKIRKISVN